MCKRLVPGFGGGGECVGFPVTLPPPPKPPREWERGAETRERLAGAGGTLSCGPDSCDDVAPNSQHSFSFAIRPSL